MHSSFGVCSMLPPRTDEVQPQVRELNRMFSEAHLSCWLENSVVTNNATRRYGELPIRQKQLNWKSFIVLNTADIKKARSDAHT